MINSVILMRVQPGKAKIALDAVKRFKEVKTVFLVFGRYDMVAFAELASLDAVKTFSSKINAIKEIRSSETLIEG
ncbi:Lrp/AsnC ligand binding domain-containing protein [Candidatus Bathyarchaeota archaeon]|nr:Lrp/AsnC ligand binding domain-containing protein [Candidatus Bathyarchaeota archaeon]